ncbi:hypothetical protein [Psychroserpens ponticola]|uniref:DUF4013 domain-containing protein n=1 Tax=Psychroserpens ponticola TaxID=2932268 RepID=A0ABY7S2D5_9FLAO|nr:hypothetical protein [Psychroserpens ponticola]WCO02626.1 hypothetical protein MUN68_003810 [Psychroserpens ponticola]
MQLYKSRDFGSFFQDTFAFLKQNGKHLYKNFFIINGIFLLILMVMGYFFSKFYVDVIFGGVINGNPNAIDDYMNENAGVFILLLLVFIAVGLIAGLISYSFVPIYLKLYTKNNGISFNTTDIIKEYKANLAKIFTFLICGILIAIPLSIISGLMMFILAITLIGILLLPLVLGALSLLYQGSLMEYFENKKSIWDSFGYSWKLIRSKFWPAVGCVGIFYFMSYIAQNVVAMIPYVFFIIDMVAEMQPNGSPDPQQLEKSMTIMMVAIFLLTFLVSSVLNVIVQINQGVVFYSLKEDNENINTKSDIDLIGSSE